MIWIAAVKFFKESVFQIGASVAVVAVLVISCNVRDAKLEKQGAEKQSAKIEKANRNATQIGGRAAARSADTGVRGTRDPSTRD